MKRKQQLAFALAAGLLLSFGVANAEDRSNKLRRGERHEMTFTEKTYVCGVALEPGTYIVQHKTKGGDHWVNFESVPESLPDWMTEIAMQPTPELVAQVRCNPEGLSGPAKRHQVITKAASEGA